MKPLSADRFGRAVANVVREMLQAGSDGVYSGQTYFMIPPPIYTTFGPTETDDLTVDLQKFRFEWFKDGMYARIGWSLYGPAPMGVIKGAVAYEVLHKLSGDYLVLEITRDIINAALTYKWIKDDYGVNFWTKNKAYNKLMNSISEDAEKHFAISESGQDWSNSGNKLQSVIPGMKFRIPEITCPGGCGANPKEKRWKFENLVIHLNDHHKWPRSANDKPPRDKPDWDMSVNIADWSEMYASTHDIDLNFRTPEEMEEIKKKKEQEHTLQGVISGKPESKWSIQFKEGELASLLKLYGLEEAADKILTPNDLVGQTMFVNIQNKENPVVFTEGAEVPKEFLFTDYSDDKKLKSMAKEWAKKYDHLLKGKWNDILPGGEA